MTALTRDLLKTRDSRLGEVYGLQHLGAGQANSQIVVTGCALTVGSTNTAVTVTAGIVMLAQAEVAVAPAANTVVAAGAVTTASQFRKVLFEVDAAGVIYQTVGNAVATQQSDAVLPAGNPARIQIGWLEAPNSFTPGTTVVTSGMLKPMPYYGPAGILSGI